MKTKLLTFVAAIALLVCEPAWELMVSGSPRTLLLPLFALAFRFYTSAAVRVAEDRSAAVPLALLGIMWESQFTFGTSYPWVVQNASNWMKV